MAISSSKHCAEVHAHLSKPPLIAFDCTISIGNRTEWSMGSWWSPIRSVIIRVIEIFLTNPNRGNFNFYDYKSYCARKSLALVKPPQYRKVCLVLTFI